MSKEVFKNPILPGFYPDPSICRVGEDYYLVNSSFSLIKRIDYEITKPFEFENFRINLRASTGYAHFREDGIELEILIEKLDKLMYEAKRERKGVVNIR